MHRVKVTWSKYRCLKCDREFNEEDLGMLPELSELRCPACSYKVIAKLRSPIAKKVEAI